MFIDYAKWTNAAGLLVVNAMALAYTTMSVIDFNLIETGSIKI